MKLLSYKFSHLEPQPFERGQSLSGNDNRLGGNDIDGIYHPGLRGASEEFSFAWRVKDMICFVSNIEFVPTVVTLAVVFT